LLCELELQHTVSIRQIRALENAQRKLEESKNSFNVFYQQSPIAYVTLSLRGYITEANIAATTLFGMDRKRLERMPFAFMVKREEVRRFLAHLARCRNAGDERPERTVTQVTLRAHHEELIHAQLISVPFSGGGHKGFLTAIVDLTERSRSQQALAEAKEFSESIVETVSQPLVVLDGDFRIISVNRAFTEFFQQPADYVRGRAFDALLNLWWSGNRLREELEKVLVKGKPLENFPLEIEPGIVGKRILLLNARRLHRKSNEPTLVLIAMEDITARKHAEEQLRDLNVQLETRVASRTEDLQKSYEQMESFCYSIAHDLRAPLRSMTGFSHLLAEQFGEQIGEAGRDYARRIEESAARMNDLIRDLLNYGQLNTQALSTGTVDLEKVFADVLAQLEKDILEKGARVRKRGRLPTMTGHSATLSAILSNLISNALKFVAPGVRPRIDVFAEERADWTRVSVADNGIGIAPQNRAKIFGVFQRLHSGEAYPGTGIGLAIVSKGVERMGGRVGLESELGKGSRFWFELPKRISG
jgi:PAS domain S-box-containing protein